MYNMFSIVDYENYIIDDWFTDLDVCLGCFIDLCDYCNRNIRNTMYAIALTML